MPLYGPYSCGTCWEHNKGIPHELLDVAIISRDALIIAMAVLVIRQMCGKTTDKVRDAHAGRDPLAGAFA